MAKFHEWKPNIYNDHHEMGADNTFFFQPGVPSRNNPLTPEENYRLTGRIASYHASFLDNIGSAYFTKEQFDDYYLGKGSSYPDVNGCVGILFEQAGFRGRIRETSNGIKKLAFGIRNQFTVTLSTLEAAIDMKDDLLSFQKNFYRDAIKDSENDPVKAYVFGDDNDPGKVKLFIDILKQHQIEVYENEKEITAEGKTFNTGSSYIVPVNQPQYRLIKGIFDVITKFEDSTFYDVSTWTIPFAYNIPYAGINSSKNLQYSDKPVETEKTEGEVIGGKSHIAYLLKWNGLMTPTALFELQNAGIKAKVA
ncbi:MAG: zinc carboxypeptidase, partial [Prolixibacteraceae bacterium]|nr:zinc carboxypeptidase [Prolixibacteraceae bacterium]